MKKLILTAFAVTCAASVFAQGSVVFNNRVVGSVVTHIYAPNSANIAMSQIGNGPTDTPSNGISWAGFTVIGANGTGGAYGAATTFAQLLGADGGGIPEASLVPMNPTTTFRTGAAGGFLTGVTSTLASTPAAGEALATMEMVAWDNSSGLYPTWTQARAAWLSGAIAAGVSGTFNVGPIGGLNPAPTLNGLQSFNLYFIPEPSTFALAGLGAAALLIFRRRK